MFNDFVSTQCKPNVTGSELLNCTFPADKCPLAINIIVVDSHSMIYSLNPAKSRVPDRISVKIIPICVGTIVPPIRYISITYLLLLFILVPERQVTTALHFTSAYLCKYF